MKAIQHDFFLKGILNTIYFSCCIPLYSSFTILVWFYLSGLFLLYVRKKKSLLLFIKIIEEYYVKSIPSNMILQYCLIRIHGKRKLCKFGQITINDGLKGIPVKSFFHMFWCMYSLNVCFLSESRPSALQHSKLSGFGPRVVMSL